MNMLFVDITFYNYQKETIVNNLKSALYQYSSNGFFSCLMLNIFIL